MMLMVKHPLTRYTKTGKIGGQKTNLLFHLLTQAQWQNLMGIDPGSDPTIEPGPTPITPGPTPEPAAGSNPTIDRPPAANSRDRAIFQAQQATLPPYAPPSLAQEGFIHLSTQEQVCGVADRFYQNQGDLILLAIDPDRLQAALRWEAPAHPDGSPPEPDAPQFPHLYGSLNWDAVIEVYDLPQQEGRFVLPAALCG